MTETEPIPDELPPVAAERPAGRLSLGGHLLLAVLVVVLQFVRGVALAVLQTLIGGREPTGSQIAGDVAVGNVMTFAAVICFGVWRSKLPWLDVVPLTQNKIRETSL